MRFMFRLLTPLMFFLAVIAYLGDFRMMSVALALAGWITYMIVERLSISS